MISSLSLDEYSLFEKHVAEFKTSAASAEGMLREMCLTLEAGMVPSEKNIGLFQAVIHELRERYSSVYQTAAGLLGEKAALLERGSSVTKLEGAVQAMKEQVTSQLRELENILEEFLAVEATVASYMDALQQWRTKASELMGQLRLDHAWHTNLNEEVRPYRLFLKAMSMSDDSSEKEELFLEIDRLFSPQVSRGLYSGKYYRPSPDLLKNSVSMDEAVQNKSEEHVHCVREGEREACSVACGLRQDTSYGHAEKDITGNEGGLVIQNVNVETDCESIQKDDVTSLDTVAHEYGSYQEEKQQAVKEKNQEDDLINTQTLIKRNDVKSFIKNNHKNCKINILHLLKIFRVMTTEQIFYFGNIYNKLNNISKEAVSSFLMLMSTKKIIKNISYHAPLWVITTCNKNKIDDIFKELNIDTLNIIKTERFYSEKMSKLDIYNVSLQNDALMHCLLDMQEHCPEEFQRAIKTVRLYNESIKIKIGWERNDYICSFALPDEELSGSRPYRLFVSSSGTGLPELKKVPAGVICFALYEGSKYRWEDGWQPENVCNFESVGTGIDALEPSEESGWEKGEVPVVSLDMEKECSQTTSVSDSQESENADLETEGLHTLGDATCEYDPGQERSVEERPSEAVPAGTDASLFDELPAEHELTESKAEERDGQTLSAKDEAKERSEVTAEQLAMSLSKQESMPSDAEIRMVIDRLFEQYDADDAENSAGVIARALMLLKAAALQGLPGCTSLYEQLSLATGTAQGTGSYAGYNLNQHFTNDSHSQSLTLAAYMYALLAPDEFDFTLQDQAKMYLQKYEKYFPAYRVLKPLFAELCSIRDVESHGFTSAVLAQLENEDEKTASMHALQKRAKELMQEPVVTVHLNGIPELLSSCFGHGSEYYDCMEVIAQNRLQDRELLKDKLCELYELHGESYELDEKKLEDAIDDAWSKATKKQNTRRLSLKMVARRQIRGAFLDRLELLKEWVESAVPLNSERVDRLRKLKNSILQILEKLPDSCVEKGKKVKYACVVPYMVNYLKNRLTQCACTPLFADALRTGFVALDDRFQPVLDKRMCEIPYYEPWRRVLKHIACGEQTLESAEQSISADPQSPMFDNLHQLELLTRLSGQEVHESSAVEKAEKRAKDKTMDFKGSLELAYAAGRITEQDKEDLLQMLLYEEDFCSSRDFGCWKQFLEALNCYKDARVAFHKKELQTQIDQRRSLGRASSILNTAERLLNEGQFAIAEEYVNIFDRNDKEDSEELRSVFDEDNHLEEFLRPGYFDLLYDYSMNTLKGRALSKGGPDFLRRHFPEGWTASYKEESIKFIQSWPSAKAKTQQQELRRFVESLGITVSEVRHLSDKAEDMFELSVRPTPCDYTDYPHPIAVFGTKMKSPLSVVALYGGKQAKDIIDKVNQLKPSSHSLTIVLLDYALSKNIRCQLAEFCHQSSGLSPFIVIDRVLALHLALHLRSERMCILLSCALPYASALQPFVRDGGPTSAEMFCGRTRELIDILNPNGTCLVYGGRQLGKTALLQRAQNRFHNPGNRFYAVFCSIKDKREEGELTGFLVEEVNKQTSLGLQACDTLKAFCNQLDGLFRKGNIQGMLLMLDEADDFLHADSQRKYASVQLLVDFKRSFNDFKFVFAGLNNVYRVRNATINNGVFGQIGQPLCIKPLSPADAMRLILRPLRYLGFKPGEDAHLETILSSTNYYPGILQFVGYKLAESLNSRTARYYRPGNNTPPVLLTSDHLGSIMTDNDLNASIKEKFRLSLKLDERYFMLARCIGMLYHFEAPMHDNYKGYTVADIRDMAESYDIHCLKELGTEEYEALLDEMFEMGILHRAEKSVYRLRKRSFLDIIGSDMTRLEQEIISENGRSLK